MREHQLDPEGLAPLPHGYIEVDSEVQFLALATESQSLLVRGAFLCNWAESFFLGRNLPFRYTRSLSAELREMCPELTEEQSRGVVQKLPQDVLEAADRPLTVLKVLQRLYPLSLWRSQPSTEHVAEWLIWLYEADPPDYLQPLLRKVGKQWQHEFNQPEQEFYQAATKGEAEQSIERWLKGNVTGHYSNPFPNEIPQPIFQRVAMQLRTRIVQGHGEYFSSLVRQSTPMKLMRETASGLVDYYRANPSKLTRSRVVELDGYIDADDLNELQNILPPDPPQPMPATPADVLDWFRTSYFPYRRWQSHCATNGEILQPVLQAAQQFATWYLTHYPGALLGQKLQQFLSFKRMVDLTNQLEAVTLVIVLDGLHAGDARELHHKIELQISRLTSTADDLVFSPLPTITSFCKPALFGGVPPDRANEVTPIGQIIPDRRSPIKTLLKARVGDLLLWRVEEPDSTYHTRNNSESLRAEISGKLDAVAQKVSKVVKEVPDSTRLQVVIVTDHGRLLARSDRKIPVPPGMESHGRAAWGRSPVSFDGQSFVIQDNVAYVNAHSFGLPQDAAIILDQSAFHTNDGKGGFEFFAHGGLFPEEVIIPWMVFERDVKPPQINVEIDGSGTARKQGRLHINVVNSDNMVVYLRAVMLDFGGKSHKVSLSQEVAPQSTLQLTHEWASWPSAEEAVSVKAQVEVSLSNRRVFTLAAEIAIRSEDMYRRDNILEDMI